MRIGLQLYTVKDECEKDIGGALRAVAAMGYDGIEFGSTQSLSIQAYKALMDELGLHAAGVMRSAEELEVNLASAVELARAVDTSTILIPGLWGGKFTGSVAAFRDGARFLNETGRRCKLEGFGFQYHIHGQEFEAFDGGITGMDILTAETDAELVRFELDTYWVDWGGADALTLAKSLGPKLGFFHIKDYDNRQDMRDVEAGTGALDVPALVAVAREAELEWLIVEQEQFTRPPMEAAAISARNLRAMVDAGGAR